ncbi:hypothetical protein RDWZM_006719 [Blomia tropicalis]|uniref:Uncharacterized protein n=1 Tax=Blomia tropicalis TaxID=40697 RepID=A0A9Q0MB30_BLOTA|nr:hypothetical protein RDWZM_006719 [Blomia tropicalis]
MKSFHLYSILCYTLLMFNGYRLQQAPAQPYQRLIMPSSGSKLTVSPGLTFPSLQLNTIDSGFTMKMPITLQFPSMTDMTQSFIMQIANMPIYNSFPAIPRNHKQQSNLSDTNEATTSTSTTTTSATITKSRTIHARINSRARFYETIEKAHKTLGKSCLLRTICEVAEVPFIASSTGFLGEIFDMLLT